MRHHKIRWFAVIVPLVLVLPTFVYGSAPTQAISYLSPRVESPTADCSVTSVGLTPLNDLGAGTYNGYVGGLYPAGANQPPAPYLTEGMTYVQAVVPRDPAGQPSCTGRIVLLSIGMSNTTQEFSTFKPMADADPAKNPQLTIVDGAQGGQDATIIRDPSAAFWTNVDTRLSSAGVTPAQDVPAPRAGVPGVTRRY